MIENINPDGAKNLALAVLESAAYDVKVGKASKQIINGGIDLWLGLAGIDISGTDFVKFVKKNGKKREKRKVIPVVCVETDKIFKSMKEAGLSVGLSGSGPISECCRGKVKTVRGFHWRCATEEEIKKWKKQRFMIL